MLSQEEDPILQLCELREQYTSELEAYLLVRNLNVTRVDGINHVVWGLAINGASNRLCCTKHLLDSTSEVFCQRSGTHYSCDRENFVQGNVSSVLNIFLLFTITWGLWTRRFSNL